MNRIRDIRKLQNLSTEELAKLAGVPRSTINSYESKGVHPRPDKAEALSRALGVTVGYLLGYEEAAGDVPDYKHRLHYGAMESPAIPLSDKQKLIDDSLPECPLLQEKIPRIRGLLDPIDLLKLVNMEHALRQIVLSEEEIKHLMNAFVAMKL